MLYLLISSLIVNIVFYYALKEEKDKRALLEGAIKDKYNKDKKELVISRFNAINWYENEWQESQRALAVEINAKNKLIKEKEELLSKIPKKVESIDKEENKKEVTKKETVKDRWESIEY